MTNSLQFDLKFPRFDFESTFAFDKGLHVIYGESGVGKSTLIDQILGRKQGVENFDLYLLNKPNNIQKVYQNPDTQIVSSTIAGELAFSLESATDNAHVIETKIKEIEKELIFKSSLHRHPATLSGGEKESLNLSTAFSVNPNCVLIDDGLSFLNDRTKENIIHQIKEKVEKTDVIVLWFTSDMNDLNYGDTQWELTLSSMQRWSESINPLPTFNKLISPGTISINCSNVTFAYNDELPIFDKMNLEINHFRSLGISGSNGCGKTTFAKLLIGVEQIDSGRLSVFKDESFVSTAYVEQFPEKMIGADSLGSFVNQLVKAEKFDRHKINHVIKHLKRSQIEWDHIKDKTALDISWVTLRFTLIILLLNCEYDLLVLDEPIFGLGRDQIINLSHYLQLYLHNKHFIIISHDHHFIHSFCDQILDLDHTTLAMPTIKKSPFE